MFRQVVAGSTLSGWTIPRKHPEKQVTLSYQLQILITGDVSVRVVVADALSAGIPKETKPVRAAPDLSDPAIVPIPQNSLQLHYLLGFG